MLDAVLLDWEGVLTDTADARRTALVRALSLEHVHLDSDAYTAHCDGQSLPRAAGNVFASLGRSDDTLADLVALRATRTFAEWLGKGFVLRPGAREFVERMQAGSRVAIVTSATRSETEFVLRLAGLDGAISTIVSAGDALDLQPSAASFNSALEQLARVRLLRRDRVVTLASTSAALRAGRSAGLRTVAVGVAAHVAVDADGVADEIDGLAIADLARLAGVPAAERQP